MCLATSSNLLLVLQDPPKHIFSTNSGSSGHPKNDAKTLFSILHPLVIFATATVVAFVLLHNSRFNFHCYTQCEAMLTQKSAWKWHCNLSRLLAWKITKGIHLCKPASLNCPILQTQVNMTIPQTNIISMIKQCTFIVPTNVQKHQS